MESFDTTLNRLAALAAHVAGVSTAVIECGDCRAAHGESRLAASGERFRHTQAFVAPRPGTLTLMDARHRGPLTAAEAAAVAELVEVTAAYLERQWECDRLAEVTDRALRTDRILRLVAKAASCAEALASLLGELCRHHAARVGRIWRLCPDDSVEEVSRFTGLGDRVPYYEMLPPHPIPAGRSFTAQCILRNQPGAVRYSEMPDQERWALMGAATACGLRSQISFPFWIQEERFGLSLAFDTERDDLPAIVADIGSLANTIHPALFRKVTEERLHHLAHHDELTGLGNRAAFNLWMAEEMNRGTDARRHVTLLYLDLDGFKLVNDTRGHAAGDALLRQVAARLRETARDRDLVARLGGDEFAVLQAGTEQPAGGVALARRLLERFCEPFTVAGQRTTVGVSIGIASFPADASTPDQLLRSADAALYEAKHSGRNTFRVFDAQLGARQRARASVRQDLEAAIGHRDFDMHFQPICELPTREVRGLEALLRWNHAERGPQIPRSFVAVAEATGLIVPLGTWGLERACGEAATWTPPLRVSVNLSPAQVRQPGLVAQVSSLLGDARLDPSRLDLEITESVLLDECPHVLRTLHELKALGVRLTMDDFGTAHASLSWLRRFSFDRIKIGRTFIENLCDDPGTEAIVQAILALGDRLGLEVVAQGVETERELEMLQRLGCGMVQGFLTGRPVPAADLGRFRRPPRLVAVG